VKFQLDNFLATADGDKTLITHRKGETVFAQGDRCDGVFYILRGECKVSVVSQQGKEAVVALHQKGHF
jgi:CRP-like cAMP-binding protein